MKIIAKKDKDPRDQWIDLNSILNTYRLTSLGSFGVLFVMLILFGYLIGRSPVVVTLKDGKKSYHQGVRANLPISEKDVEALIAEFIVLRYEWDKMVPSDILFNTIPFTTEGFRKKLGQALKKEMAPALKDKKLSQYTGNIKVTVTKKQVIASFDRILRIENKPIAVPTEISLSLISGSRTRWNPLGLYINGIIEHEVK